MNRLDLEFICAYADIYCNENTPMEYVINQINELFAEGHNNDDEYQHFSEEGYKMDFLEHYKAMKEYHLENEIKFMVNSGFEFFSACYEWDI